MFRVEIVPFTNRVHLVCSPQVPRAACESCFAGFKKEHAGVILPLDHENTVRVNRILSKIVGTICFSLAQKTQEPLDFAARLDWEAIVLRDKHVRAKCWVGGGKIAVYTGLLDRFDTDEEIASVLAHEVGHVIARHTSEIFPRFAKWFPTFLMLPMLRTRELEADYIGMMLLAACGFDPHVAPRTLDKLEKMRRKCISNNVLHFLALSTHPSPKKRSKFLSRPKLMEGAMRLYTKASSTGLGSDKAA